LSSFSYLFLSLPSARLTLFEAICAGLITTALFLSGVPSPAETFYWLAGGTTYQLANCLYLVLLSVLTRMELGSTEIGKRTLWFTSALVLILAGLNETVMLLQSITIMLAFLLAFMRKSRHCRLLLWLLALSLVGAAAVIAAPGNAVRSVNFPLAHDFVFSLKDSILHAGVQFLYWSTSLPLWLATVIWFPFASKAVKPSGAPGLRTRCTVTAVFVWLSLLAAMYFPAFWSMGAAPPTRTLSTVYTVFVVGWFMTVTLIAASMPLGERAFTLPRLRFAAVALAGLLFATGNGATACNDLATAPGYSKQLKERYLMLGRTGTKLSDIKVPALHEHPDTIAIHFGDISADKDDWKNRNYAEYFKLKSVATAWKQP
jgi:hypothetical protein